MKTGLNNKQKLFICSFLCFVLIAVFIVVINITLGAKTKTIKAENTTLENEYETLQVYVLNRETYEADTKVNNETVEQLANTYLGGITKTLVLSEYEDIFEEYNLESTSLTVSDAEEFGNITIETDKKEEGYVDLVYKKMPISIAYSVKYSTLKNFIKDLVDLDQKISIDSISIAHDDATGNVTGTITMNWASIEGYKDYVAPTYTDKLGVQAMFSDEGTVEVNTGSDNVDEVNEDETSEETTAEETTTE